MKKILIIIFVCILMCGCKSNIPATSTPQVPIEPTTYSWPNTTLVKFNKGEVVYSSGSEEEEKVVIHISGVTYQDFLDYVDALKVMNYSFYDSYKAGTNEYLGINDVLQMANWVAFGNNKYLVIHYYEELTGDRPHNLEIIVYNSKPTDWK